MEEKKALKKKTNNKSSSTDKKKKVKVIDQEINEESIVIEESKDNKNATFSRRLTAYFIDLLLVGMAIGIIGFIFPASEKETNLSDEITELTNNYIDKKVTQDEYVKKANNLNYELSKETYVITLIDLCITILYFVVYQFKNKATIGKRIMGLKIIKEDGELQINDLIVRSFIVNTLMLSILNLGLLFILSKSNYTQVTSFIMLMQYGLIFITMGFMLFRKDRRSLHDLITNTRVVEI